MKKTLNIILRVPREVGKVLIKGYQITLSTDHSFWANPEEYRICVHSPSCSQYTYEAVDKFGVVQGSIMGFFRILRCNGYAQGGYDPLPDKFSIKKNDTPKE